MTQIYNSRLSLDFWTGPGSCFNDCLFVSAAGHDQKVSVSRRCFWTLIDAASPIGPSFSSDHVPAVLERYSFCLHLAAGTLPLAMPNPMSDVPGAIGRCIY